MRHANSNRLPDGTGAAAIDDFTDLLTLVAVEAPELKEPASAIARGFGEGDPAEEARWQEWARGIFIYPKPQPREESKADTQPASETASKALVVKRRKLPSLPKPDAAAMLAALLKSKADLSQTRRRNRSRLRPGSPRWCCLLRLFNPQSQIGKRLLL